MRRAGDDDVVARPEIGGADSLLLEPPRVSPFRAEAPHDAAAVGRVEVDPCMRVPVLEADDVAFERNLFLFRVVPRERVVRIRGARGQQ